MADRAVYHGLAGDIVRAAEPTTEADPVAVLVQQLVAFGNVVGRGPHFRAEDDLHHLVENVLIVGKTAKGRKGMSFNRVYRVTSYADPEWAGERIVNGLSSGEGLIEQVRDPRSRDDDGDDPRPEGDPERRLLVQEGEFASVLKNIERTGNVLSMVIRNAWDGRTLRTLTRNNPLKATDPHISLIGHITVDELVRLLSTTEAANGFMNRFLIVLAKRSKLLPDGATLADHELRPLQDRLKEAVVFARDVREVKRDRQARDLWHAVYGPLSEGRPGLAGSILARAEAHAMRLACLYALLDCSCFICEPHLKAALALWDYCQQSVVYIWGDTLGDPTADLILQALRASPTGLTREEIRELFHRNKASAEIGRALGVLEEYKLATCERVATGGRPAEVWSAGTRYTP